MEDTIRFKIIFKLHFSDSKGEQLSKSSFSNYKSIQASCILFLKRFKKCSCLKTCIPIFVIGRCISQALLITFIHSVSISSTSLLFSKLPGSPRRSPGQRRRSQVRRSLTHQSACVDVSPEPRSLQDAGQS